MYVCISNVSYQLACGLCLRIGLRHVLSDRLSLGWQVPGDELEGPDQDSRGSGEAQGEHTQNVPEEGGQDTRGVAPHAHVGGGTLVRASERVCSAGVQWVVVASSG